MHSNFHTPTNSSTPSYKSLVVDQNNILIASSSSSNLQKKKKKKKRKKIKNCRKSINLLVMLIKVYFNPQTLVLNNNNPVSNRVIIVSRRFKENQLGFRNPSSYTRSLPRHNRTNRRKYVVYNGVQPGVPPSGPPPSNILSWILAVSIAVVIPLVNYKWGPLLKKKIESALQVTEDVVEAVEKVAAEVEKVAEDIADDFPEGGKFRKAVDFVEKLAERTAKDAGFVDDFIDKVQEEEDKAEAFIESLKDVSARSKTKTKDQNVEELEEKAETLVESHKDDIKKIPEESDNNKEKNQMIIKM